ncbi:hypothetical protein Bca4012_037931 [Brassica carinata]
MISSLMISILHRIIPSMLHSRLHIRIEEDSSVRRDLAAANRVIADHNEKFKAMANMFDMFIESTPNVNPLVASAWQTLRPSFNVSQPTPEEQADLDRRVEQRISDLFDEINLNA